MGKLHEFDVALTPGIASPASTTRVPSTEIHLNVWQLGVKGSGTPANIGDSSVTSTTGLQIVPARPAIAQTNMPSEIVLGDTSAAPGIIDLKQIYCLETSATSTVFTGFGIEE